MARKLVASGVAIVAAGGYVCQVTSFMGSTLLYDITATFPASAVPHTHYEIGDQNKIGAVFVGGTPPAGSLWVITSTHPPGPTVWPNGSRQIQLCTHNRHLSVKQTGTMRKTAAGKSVYTAQDILFWI